MQIENKTEFKKDMIKNIMRADGFDNQTYKTKKLVLNMSGLVCGMVSVSIFARTMYSIDDSYKSIAFVFAAICAVLLYAGMYGIDKNSLKLFTAQYSKNVGIVYEYVITSDEIDVKVNDDNYIIPWDSVEKWCEDTESFYLFLKCGSNEKQAVGHISERRWLICLLRSHYISSDIRSRFVLKAKTATLPSDGFLIFD